MKDGSHLQKMATRHSKQAEEMDPLITNFVITGLNELLARNRLEDNTLKSLPEDISAKEKLKIIIRALYEFEHFVAIPDDSQLWMDLPDRVAEMFIDTHNNPLHFNPSPYIADGILVYSPPDSSTSETTAEYYIRLARASQDAFLRYIYDSLRC